MMINQKKLEEVFEMLPTVSVFVNNNEHSMAYASSFSDVGGRDEDVFQNIKHIYITKDDCNVDIAIDKFYSLGTRTIIQLQIGGEQKSIVDLVDEALNTAVLCEIARISSDYFKLVNYFTNLRNIVYILSPDNATELADKINKYITFVYWSRERMTESKRYIKDHYDLFRAGAFTPNKDVRLDICDTLDLYNILDNVEDIVPQETIYPINMQYIDGKFSTEIVATISNACYKIKRFTCEERNISNIDIDSNDFVDEFIDKAFSEEAAELISRILMEYFIVSIFVNRTADGDIVIKFVDGEDIICLARITPTKETIIW